MSATNLAEIASLEDRVDPAKTQGVQVDAENVQARAAKHLHEMQQALYKRTDHMFAMLLFAQWLGGILVACLISPLTWAGRISSVHIHIWTAVLGGAIIALPPILLAIKVPGRAI